MKILARQLTVDMYDCKNKDLSNYEDLRESLDMAMNMAGYTPIEVRAQLWNEEQAIVFILPIAIALILVYKKFLRRWLRARRQRLSDQGSSTFKYT